MTLRASSSRRATAACRRIALLLFAFVLSSTVVADDHVTLRGRVLDPAGQPIAGAVVSARAGGRTATATADRQGRFQVDRLPPGPVRLTVEAPGFATLRLKALDAADDHDLTLTPRVEGTITVTSSLPALATEVEREGRAIVDRGNVDLGASLRDVAGAAAIRRGPVNLEPAVRGLQEEQVALLVDGTRTFAAGPARMDSGLSHVSPHLVESLRVVKGPYALTWGAGALSAIQVDLVQPSFGAAGTSWTGGAIARYTDNADRLDAHGRIAAAGVRWRFSLAAGVRSGADYRAGDGTEVPADYRSSEQRLHLGLRPSDTLLLEIEGGYQGQDDIDFPGRLLDATYFRTRSYDLELSWTGAGGLGLVFAQVYSNRKDHRMNNDEKPTGRDAPGRVPPFALRVDLPTEANTAGGRLRLGWQRGDLEWTLGSDAFRLEQTAERRVFRRSNDLLLFRDAVWPEAEIDNLGVYAQVVVRGGRHRLGATVRGDFVDASASALSPFYRANTVGATSQSETNLSAAVSLAVELGERVTLHAGVGRAVRSANVLERYSDRFPATKFQLAAELMGNPALDPEVGHELSLGTEARLGTFGLHLDVFYRLIDDYITVVPDPSLPRRLPLSPPLVYRYVNGSEATFWGGELRLDDSRTLDAGLRVAWRLALSYVRGEDRALDEPVLGIEPLTVRAGLRLYAFDDRLWVDLDGRAVDRQDRVATSRFEQQTPGYTVFDLAARYAFDDRWSLSLGVENLGDKTYADHLNAPNPFTRERVLEIGRAVRAGIEVTF